MAPSLEGRLLCASVCAYAAQPDGTLGPIDPYLEGAGFEEPPVALTGGPLEVNACIVGKTPDGVVVSFRGTLPPSVRDLATLLDWAGDVNVAPTSASGIPGMVHGGFWSALDSLWTRLSEELNRRLSENGAPPPVLITGHSKGGGIAPLAAARVFHELEVAAHVCTFAAPRSADAEFARAYDKRFRSIRYECQDDLVPNLPPTRAFVAALSPLPVVGRHIKSIQSWDYSSVGKLRFIDWSGRIVDDTPFLGARRLFQLGNVLASGQFRKLVDDHNPRCGFGYMSALCPSGLGA